MATPSDEDSDVDRAPSDWVWCAVSLVIAAFMLLFASVAESWPPTNTATETAWISPSLCHLGEGQYVGVHGSVFADESLPALGASCPPTMRSRGTPQAFVFQADTQGWPTGAMSNLTLVCYHEDGDHISFALTLHDADGNQLLGTGDSHVVIESKRTTPVNDRYGQRRPSRRLAGLSGRRLKGGGGGGGGHSHRGRGQGGHSTTAMRPASSLLRYSYASSTRTMYGRRTRHAVIAGTAVFMMHSPDGWYGRSRCTDYARCEYQERVPASLTRDVISSAGSFVSQGLSVDDVGRDAHAGSSALAFPLTLSISSLEVRRPLGEHAVPAGPYFTLYSSTGAIDAAASDGTAQAMRKLVWFPIFAACFFLLRQLLSAHPDGVRVLLSAFGALVVCAVGYQF